ncbi:MAG TPA: C4-type zinc ribbon domain-containing protein [Bacteroidaceae bacterium]|nr:C4-type zinc ribbon domain-containing protein [Bacteroidaceae bacterium]
MTKEIKKDPVDYSVEEKLTLLYQLQTMLSDIDRIKTMRGELPLEVQDLEDEVTGLLTRIEKNKLEIAAISKNVLENKQLIESSKIAIDKYKANLDNVRNNREYDSLNKEIEYKGLEIELSEKKIREFTVAINSKQEELDNNMDILNDKRLDLEQKKSELDEIVEETRMEEEKIREKAKKLELSIDPRLLWSFKRIRKNTRNGLGIVYVQRDACGGCFNKIPPQRQLDIRMRKKIIVCEYCGRIMIDPELAGVEDILRVEEKKTPKKRERKKTVKSTDTANKA